MPCLLVSLDKIVPCNEICTKFIEKCGNIAFQAIWITFAECKWPKTIFRSQKWQIWTLSWSLFLQKWYPVPESESWKWYPVQCHVPVQKIYEYPPPPPEGTRLFKKELRSRFLRKICLWRVVLVCKLTDNTVN